MEGETTRDNGDWFDDRFKESNFKGVCELLTFLNITAGEAGGDFTSIVEDIVII